MRVYVPESISGLPQLDIFSRSRQVFQGPLPNVARFIVKKSSNADVLLVPHDAVFWPTWYTSKIRSWSNDIPIIFFNRSDYPVHFEIQNGFSLQNSFTIKHKISQLIIPYNVLGVQHLPNRAYSKSPTISFTGFVPRLSPGRALNMMLDDFPRSLVHNSLVVRRLGIRQIRKVFPSHEIIARSHYGGAKSLIENHKLWRSEYENSIQISDFVFCPRGDANSSQRFYEVISAGRIPVIPQTGQQFPKCDCSKNHLEDSLQISWDSRDVGQVIDAHWGSLTQELYDLIQGRLRDSFDSCFRYDRFLENLLSEDLNFFKRFVHDVDAF